LITFLTLASLTGSLPAGQMPGGSGLSAGEKSDGWTGQAPRFLSQYRPKQQDSYKKQPCKITHFANFQA
jgi:hypothetical protein